MAHRVKLTKTVVDRLDLAKGDGQWTTDSEVPQLLVRLTPTAKTYIARWTSTADGKRKQEAIAQVGMISVDEARNRVRKLVSADANPTAETLGDIYKIWDQSYASSLAEASASEFRRSWVKHIEPAWGKKKLSRITHSTLQDWYNAKRQEYPVSQKGEVSETPYAPDTVNRWVSYISKLLSIARKRRHLVGDPLEGIEKSSPRKRMHIFTVDDVKELGDRLDAVEDKYPIGVGVIRFLMMTPCRGIEAREMEWADLDLKSRTWTIPAHRYKTKQDKVFSLDPIQIALLESLDRWSDIYVFPSPGKRGQPVRKEYQRDTWVKVRPKPLGAHTLRKSIATWLINNTVPMEAISKLLGHSSITVTQNAYAHLSPQIAGKYLGPWLHLLDDHEEAAAEAEADDPELAMMIRSQSDSAAAAFDEAQEAKRKARAAR